MTISAQLTREYGRLSQGREGSQSFEYNYLIRESAGTAITSDDILDANVLPKFNTRITGTQAFLTSRELWPEEENRSIWYARLTFETITQEVEATEDPTKFPSEVNYTSFAREVVAERAYQSGDTQGSPSQFIGNTVNDPFDPPILENEDYLVINITKNYSNFDPNNIVLYKNTLNKDEITVAGIQLGAQQGWMMDLQHAVQYDQDGDAYDRVMYSIAVNRDTWKKVVLNAGYQFKASGETDKKPIRVNDINSAITRFSNEDAIVTTPQLLNADGTLNITDPPVPVELTFQTKFAASWRPLDLPTRKDGTA